ncbi:MAG TPA: polyphosphate kinase 2 family protein [bacterium]|nr:polyphosphate kinase 2 family protein [bacterium]
MKEFRVNAKGAFKLKDVKADYGSGDKAETKEKLLALNKELEMLQEQLYAEHKHKVLVILQAMDTGGKDGVIRHVFEGVNPQGVRVAGFKAPTPLELDHDYLWRVHQQAPAKGELVIFNRSHYEDVLVVAVHQLVPEKVWCKRYDQINDFERMLAEEGTTICKFFLHIDLDEQKQRLQERLENPDKQWKFNPDDLKERKLWPEYMKAYEAVLRRTSTDWAPWYVVPSNKKWFRNYVVASILVKTLRGLNMKYPKADFDPSAIQIDGTALP